MDVKIVLSVFTLACAISDATACMTFVAGKRVSSTDHVIVGHNEDDFPPLSVHHGIVPARDWPSGSVLPATDGCCASIPQVPHTFACYWSEVKFPKGDKNADSFLNENGVIIVSDSGGRSKERNDDPSLLTEGGVRFNLRRIVGERAKSARDGVRIIGEIVEKYGYAPSARIYTVADRDEAWLVQVVHGRNYVAVRCPDDEITVMPNLFTVYELDAIPPGDVVASSNLIENARSKGFWDGKGKFNFAKAYQASFDYGPDHAFEHPNNTSRFRQAIRLLTGGEWPEGKPFPFSVKPAKGTFSVEDMKAILSAHNAPLENGRHVRTSWSICAESTIESSVCEFAGSPGETILHVALGHGCEKPYLRLRPFAEPLPQEIDESATAASRLATHVYAKAQYTPKVSARPQARGVMLSQFTVGEDDFKTLKEWGATVARYQMYPVGERWKGKTSDTAGFAAWLDWKLGVLKDEALPLARKYGIPLVVDLHVPPGGRGGSGMKMLDDPVWAEFFVDCWRKIAGLLKDEKGVYAYDLINEPTQFGAPKECDWLEIQRRAADAIRKIDPATPIVVSCNADGAWCAPSAFKSMKPLNLVNIFYQFHMYEPFQYTHQKVLPQFKDTVAAYPDETKGWNAEGLRRMVAPVRDFELRHGARIFVGEFSAIAYAKGCDRWIADVGAILNGYGWDWCYHAFREWPGWSVEHVVASGDSAATAKFAPSDDNPRRQALTAALSAPRAFAKPITMMSYNIRIGCGLNGAFKLPPGDLGHLPQVAKNIRDVDPDWVAIQEIDSKTKRAGFVDQTKALANLCGMKGFFVRKTLNTQKNKFRTSNTASEDEFSGSGEYGLAILSKTEPIKVSKVLVPGYYHTRCIEFVEFDDYVVACTHFPLKEEHCIIAAKVALANIADFRKPVFLAGDFNVSPESATIAELRKGMTILSDTSAKTYPSNAPKVCIDYIMVDTPHAERVSVKERRVIADAEATDHCAIVVKVELK